MKLSLDAMGGDNAPDINIDGAKQALEHVDALEKLYLVGDEAELKRRCDAAGFGGDPRLEIVHASEVVGMDESGLVAVRQKKHSSMSIAVDLVKDGVCDAVLSAGNTGAEVAACTIKLRLLQGWSARALSPHPQYPQLCAGERYRGQPGCQAQPPGGVRGHVRHDGALHLQHPGTARGGDEQRHGRLQGQRVLQGDVPPAAPPGGQAAAALPVHRQPGGARPFEGDMDVALTDGFTGNILLKSVEATAKAFAHMIKDGIKKSPLAMMGALGMRGVFRDIGNRLNADAVGGCPLMGVKGVSIIAHGSANGRAILNAIRMAEGMCRHSVNDRIIDAMASINEELRHLAEEESVK